MKVLDKFSLFKNISIDETDRLKNPILFTVLKDIVNMVPFIMSIEIVNLIFEGYTQPGKTLDVSLIWVMILILFIYMLVMFFAERKAYRHNYHDAYELSSEGRIKLAEHLRKLSLGYITSKDPGDLANLIMGDYAVIETGISHLVPQLVGALVMPIFAFLSLIFIDYKMAIAMFISLPIALLILKAFNNFNQRLNTNQMDARVDAGNKLQEYIYGIKVIKAYNIGGTKFKRLEKSFKDLMDKSIKVQALTSPSVLLAISFVRAGLTFMILMGTYLMVGGELNVLTFVMFLIVGSRVYDPFTSSVINFAELKYDELAGERILELMNEPEMTGNRLTSNDTEITFENVSFAYNEEEVLHNINCQMKNNTMTALVGPSGSGKSTFIKLASRFYDPTSGKVFIGGIDESTLDPEDLMKRISVVFQDVYLFRDTVKNNILFGRKDATDEEVIEAAKKAQCHEFIEKLPNGYDTMIGEGGNTLSGGEKQRISIARAILKNAPIILLDEATASLDPENEIYIQKAINELVKDSTLIVIAHKLKTIKNADNIIVLDNGWIKEQGTHEELINNEGLYNKLWDLENKVTLSNEYVR